VPNRVVIRPPSQRPQSSWQPITAKFPKDFQSLVDDLHAAMIELQHQTGPHLCITHGDCWYRNAIKTRESGIVLIDWDQSGIGLPELDLGNLLLSSHFNFDQPLQIQVDKSKIKVIVQGYQSQCPIRAQNVEHMANTMRFLLAWQLGSYITDDRLFLHPDFPFVLQKLQVRYQATRDIAHVTVDYIS
jgi:thiamine kinase-like enzyme